MSSEDEFYDAFEEPDGPPKPAIRLEESSSPEVEEMQRLGIDDEAQSTQSTRSTQSSTLDLDVTTHGEGETTPRLSQYQRKFGTSHPLAALAEGGEAVSDSVSELGTPSVSGTPSEVRTHSVGGSQASVALSMIYEEKSQRPRRVKVKVKKKSKGEFSSMMLIQELSTGIKDSSAAPLFAAKFSLDGNYLAVGGEDGRIRLWKTIIEDTMTMMSEDSSFKPPRMVAIFQQEPIQVLEGHEGSILDLSWSKNNFLLSASMDRTVRLWHFSRSDCLGVFRHPDFVTAVAFHPRDDRIFITGSLDCRLRLWSIADKAVRAWNELPANNFVTAVSFNTSGKLVLAGTATGVCLIFETDGFNYTLQIHVHSRRGKNKIGKKICGIEPMPGKAGDETILISSNDSRVRLYTLRDKSVISKFIGHTNQTSQIKATFSDDGEYLISGSEDNRVYIWNVENRFGQRSIFSRTPLEHVKSCEYYHGHSKPVTCALFAPSSIRNRLQSVGLRPIHSDDNPSEGQIVVAVDLNGKIKVYENNSVLENWLAEGE